MRLCNKGITWRSIMKFFERLKKEYLFCKQDINGGKLCFEKCEDLNSFKPGRMYRSIKK